MQIKITIDDATYKKLKKSAKDNLRSMSNEAFFRLRESFTTPAPVPIIPTPTYIPHGAPGGIPVEPYKITLQADTTAEPQPQPVKTKREKNPEWFTSDGKLKIIGAEDKEEETGEPIETVYKFDEPEPEWDADRGGARPRVR